MSVVWVSCSHLSPGESMAMFDCDDPLEQTSAHADPGVRLVSQPAPFQLPPCQRDC
jgi:hypothetical protein